MAIDHWMRKAAGGAAATNPASADSTEHTQPVSPTLDCRIPGVRPDLTGLHHWTDPAAKPPAKQLDPVAQVQENLKELEATRYAQTGRARSGRLLREGRVQEVAGGPAADRRDPE